MALITYPLNHMDYSAEDAELFHCTRSSGIYAGEDFQPAVTGSDRSITIGPGLGWIRNSKFSGKVVAQKESVTLDLGLSDATYPRIDAVAIRFSAVDNRTELVVKQGAAASTPSAPALERTEAVYELHLCHVRRPAGSAMVSVADVTDLRMSPQYCGLMADSVSRVDTEKIDKQISALVRRLDAAISATQRGAGSVCKTLLWENEEYTGEFVKEFPARNILVACENYDGIEIILYEDNFSDALRSSGVIPFAAGTRIEPERVDLGEKFGKKRPFVIHPDHIHVGTGEHWDSEGYISDDQAMVPVKIYGYTGIIDPNDETPPGDVADAAGQGNQVFIATYGETTIDEVIAAVQAGKTCFAEEETGVYLMSSCQISLKTAFFGRSIANAYCEICLTADGWSRSEWLHIKTGVVDEGSDHNYVPTAKAVWDLNKPLLLDADSADVYLRDSYYGDAALKAIKAGRQILVKVPNADGGSHTAIYCPIMMYQLPNYANQYLYLFFLRDEKQDLSALLGLSAGSVQMPTYGELKMLLSQEYNEDPLAASV